MHTRFRLPAGQYLLYFLIASTVVLLITHSNVRHVTQGTLVDPDSYMRLVRIQEALDHGRWFGDVVSRDVSGRGDVLSWSHLCGAACTVLAALHARFAPYPTAGAAMLLPVLLSLPALARRGPLVRPGLITAFLYAPMLLSWLLAPVSEAEHSKASMAQEARCPVRAAATLLAPRSGAVVLAGVNEGPELLYRSHIKIVGSLYHSGVAGFMRLRAAWRARDLDDVPSELRATGAQYVLVCPGAPRIAIVDGPKTTLFDRLNDGDPPAWLHPVAHQPGSDWTLYEIAQTL